MISVSLNPKLAHQKLDPRSINYTNEFYLLENLTSRLISLDERGEYQLELASDLLKVNDKEFHFKIKDSSFSNGEKISLSDVKNSIERIRASGSTHVDFKGVIESLEILDDKLIVKLEKPSKSFFYYLSLPDLGVLHKNQIAKRELMAQDFVSISSGPFYYSASGSKVSLKKNLHYKITPSDYPDEVVLIDPFSKDTLKDVLQGKIQLGQESTKSFLKHKDEIEKSDSIRVLGVPSDSLTYLFFNDNSKKYKDVEVRKWIAKKISDNFVVPSSFSQIARRAAQYFPPESIAYLNEQELNSINEQIPVPKDLPEEIVIHTYTSVYNVTIEELVAKLEKIPGLKIKIVADVPPDQYLTFWKNGSFDIFLNIMSTDIRTPVEAINFEYFSPDAILSDKTGSIKTLFTQYQNTTSKEDERRYMKDISRQIIKDGQVIPLFHSAIPFVYDSSKVNIKGLSHLFVMNFWKIKTL